MAVVDNRVTMHLAEFITSSHPPVEALRRAAIAVCDTVGVILAGVAEPASNILRRTITGECRGPCHLLGTADRTSAAEAALANGVAAHAHDYDDMCFVSMAHPSCALVPAALAAAESTGASGRLDRKSTRLNSSHSQISYAVFCLKKKKKKNVYDKSMFK